MSFVIWWKLVPTKIKPRTMVKHHCAAEKGHLDVVRHLVEVGARQNEATRDTAETALHAAAESGHVEIVRF